MVCALTWSGALRRSGGLCASAAYGLRLVLLSLSARGLRGVWYRRVVLSLWVLNKLVWRPNGSGAEQVAVPGEPVAGTVVLLERCTVHPNQAFCGLKGCIPYLADGT